MDSGKKRSCEDHAFVLSSVLRNRMLEQKSTYIAFIDFEKAFDWIDRDMLMYKLMASFIKLSELCTITQGQL